MSEPMNILLAEDDPNLGFLLAGFLESKSFNVNLFKDGEEAWNGFTQGTFDFCILDVMMPRMNGFDLAIKIREVNQEIPIIMLTAKDQDEDKLRGFAIGIDDYVTKPFNEEELVYRIHAINSRINRGMQMVESETEDYVLGSFEFECKNQLLKCSNTERRLTKTEAEVLKVLCNSANNIVSRTEIMKAVWGEEDYFVGRSLDVFISKLRKYLSEDPNIKIDTIPKVGLVLRIEE